MNLSESQQPTYEETSRLWKEYFVNVTSKDLRDELQAIKFELDKEDDNTGDVADES